MRIGRQGNVIRNKSQVRIRRNDDRMKTAPNFDAGSFKDFRAHIAALASRHRKAEKRIRFRNSFGDLLQFVTLGISVPSLREASPAAKKFIACAIETVTGGEKSL